MAGKQAPTRVRELFNALRREALTVDADLRIYIVEGEEFEFPEERSLAYTYYESDDRPMKMVVAPKIIGVPEDRIEAILRHEFGHALLISGGAHDHSEREADHVAETLWGEPIFYDEKDIQSLCCGVRPRPDYLHR